MKTIKFLATSDFHSDLKLIEKIKIELEKNPVDFVLITGDISEKKDDFSKLLSILLIFPLLYWLEFFHLVQD